MLSLKVCPMLKMHS